MNSFSRWLVKTSNTSWYLSANQLIMLTCAYLTLVLNFPFLRSTYNAISLNQDYSLLFLFSVPVFLCSLFIIINSVIGIGVFLKPILIITVCTSCVIFYATINYGIVFDYGMFQNAVETDTAEALSYVNLNLIASFFAFGIVPVMMILKTKLKQQSIVKALVARLNLVIGSVAIVAVIAFFFFANYAAVGRNNHDLVNYITPYKLVSATMKYAKKNYFAPPLAYSLIDPNPYMEANFVSPKVTVLVLGETARAQNFSLNGYAKNTNPFTQAAKVVSFTEVSSCGTATAVSVPCMFSRLNRINYDNRIAIAQQNVIDIASLAGTDVLWIDNNNGSCKGVCNRVTSISIEPDQSMAYCDDEYCLDEALLAPLQEKLNNLGSQDTLIVLHMMGSHGPTYYRRYPKDKTRFQPDCQRSDIQHCSHDELVNSYDNTIAYTDFVLGKMISLLNEIADKRDVQTSLVYVSDHGESLGENGVYLHGMPYAFAPEEQTHVPLLFWQSDNHQLVDTACLTNIRTQAISHDNWFDLVLGLTAVQSKVYDQSSDPLAQCRHPDRQLVKSNQADQTIGE